MLNKPIGYRVEDAEDVLEAYQKILNNLKVNIESENPINSNEKSTEIIMHNSTKNTHAKKKSTCCYAKIQR